MSCWSKCATKAFPYSIQSLTKSRKNDALNAIKNFCTNKNENANCKNRKKIIRQTLAYTFFSWKVLGLMENQPCDVVADR